MSKWVLKGLRTGIQTTGYPYRPEAAPGVSPGRPAPDPDARAEAAAVVSRCPSGALGTADGGGLDLDYARCVHCFRCARGDGARVGWSTDVEWARVPAGGASPLASFARSLHLRVVDAGACGACLGEVGLLTKPHYNMHRLGFFTTPTPRRADVLLVTGPLTAHLRSPLRLAYEAMPAPKRVIAVGTCATSGGLFGESFACGARVADVVPVDVALPGCPPPPLAILHALLVAVGRRPVDRAAGAVPALASAEQGGRP